MAIDVVFPVPSRRRHGARADKAAVTHAWRPLPAAPVLGLIDNTKARAKDLLEAIGKVLVQRGVVGSYFIHSKPSPSYPIGRDVRAELGARAHVIVSGLGD